VNKQQVIDLVTEYGDATITYRSTESKKLKYNVCTLDFDNEHIKTKPTRAEESEDNVLMFCWDIDSYRLLKPANISSVVPLNNVLREKNGK